MKKNNWQGWTKEKVLKLHKAGTIRLDESQLEILDEKVKKKSKFNNNKKLVDGIVFDSEKEAERYKYLLFLQKIGEIGLLRLQVPYELNEGGTHSLKYIADFVYVRKDGVEVVEDTKGYKTDIYKKKRRLMKEVHGIEILET